MDFYDYLDGKKKPGVFTQPLRSIDLASGSEPKKSVRFNPEPRFCGCGARLNRYNLGDTCSPCKSLL